jgi:CheY-like chemotaxis protein
VSGLEIARAIKRNPRTAEIPVVALSGHSEQRISSAPVGPLRAEHGCGKPPNAGLQNH